MASEYRASIRAASGESLASILFRADSARAARAWVFDWAGGSALNREFMARESASITIFNLNRNVFVRGITAGEFGRAAFSELTRRAVQVQNESAGGSEGSDNDA